MANLSIINQKRQASWVYYEKERRHTDITHEIYNGPLIFEPPFVPMERAGSPKCSLKFHFAKILVALYSFVVTTVFCGRTCSSDRIRRRAIFS